MKLQRHKHIASVDHDTGELLDGVVAWVPKKHFYQQNHFIMFQDVLEKLSKMDLPQKDMQVLMYLMSKMDWENVCLVNQKKVAEDLNMRPSHVSRSIKNLADYNIIIKGEGKVGRTPTLRLNNTLLWKGKTKIYQISTKDAPISFKGDKPDLGAEFESQKKSQFDFGEDK